MALARITALDIAIAAAIVLAAFGGAAFAGEGDDAVRMLELLRTGTEAERIEAARWLGVHRVQEALPLLRQIARHTPPGSVSFELRTAAALASELLRRPELLAHTSPEDVVAHLDDPDPEARAAAVRLVPYFGLGGSAEAVAERLEDPDAAVRAEAIRALGLLDLPRYADRVAGRLEDSDPVVRSNAVSFLQMAPAPGRIAGIAALVADRSDDVRTAAVYALQGWKMQGLEVEDAVVDVLEEAAEPDRRARCLDALSRLARVGVSGDWTARVVPFLEDADPDVRLHAAMAIGGGDDRAVAILEAVLRDEDPVRRLEAAKALARSGATLDPATVASVIRDPDLETARQGVMMAAALPAAKSRRILVRAIEEVGQRVDLLTLAVACLADVGEREDVETLAEIGRATDSESVRVNVIIALAGLERQLGSTVALDWYREILQDDEGDRAVRAAAIEAVRQMGDETFLPVLAECLRACPDNDGAMIAALAETISALIGREIHGDEFGRGREVP